MKTIYITLGVGMFALSCQKAKISLADHFSRTETCELTEMTEYPADSILHPDFIFTHDDFIHLSEPES
ncbi:MAG: hypothetical protein LBH06_07720 [Rikenellaceae bacterium]|jgi:hypothetical protein|nr:hypothetical protein [Rikenellaceae bacterium]